MAKKIQFKDKLNVPLYPVTIQKITTGVEYGTDEWIDGKQVFRKRVNCGTLPATATNQVYDLGVSIAYTTLRMYAIAKGPSNSLAVPNCFPDSTGTYNIYLLIKSDNKIEIHVGRDRSTYTLFVDTYYTKN